MSRNSFGFLMELSGLEPLTPRLPGRVEDPNSRQLGVMALRIVAERCTTRNPGETGERRLFEGRLTWSLFRQILQPIERLAWHRHLSRTGRTGWRHVVRLPAEREESMVHIANPG